MVTPMVGRALVVSAGAVAVLAGISSSRAATLAYENFGGYVSLEANAGLTGRICPNGLSPNPVGGQALPGATSGIYNWVSAGPWGANRVVDGNLTYGNLITGGAKRFQSYSGGVSVQAVMNPTVFTGLTGTGTYGTAIGASGTSMYLSFLFKINGMTTAGSQANIDFQEQTAATTFAGRFNVGQQWGAAGITAQGMTLAAAVDNNVHLVVMKIDYSGTMMDATDQVSLWYDPNLSLPEASQAAPLTYTQNMSFSQINFVGQGVAANDSTKMEADELRFGTSWGDIVPVPEPTMLALLGVSGGLFMRRRRA